MPTRVPRYYLQGIYKKSNRAKKMAGFFPAFLEAKADFGGRQRGSTYDNTSSPAVSRTNSNIFIN